MSTYGPDYDPALDKARIAKQHERIRDLMLDGQWRTLDEIAAATDDPSSSISAQLRHLRKERFGSYIVTKRRRGDPKDGLWEYQVQWGTATARRPPEPLTPAEWAEIWGDLYLLYEEQLKRGDETTGTMHKLVEYAAHKGYPDD